MRSRFVKLAREDSGKETCSATVSDFLPFLSFRLEFQTGSSKLYLLTEQLNKLLTILGLVLSELYMKLLDGAVNRAVILTGSLLIKYSMYFITHHPVPS